MKRPARTLRATAATAVLFAATSPGYAADPICRALAQFSASIRDSATHKITLYTEWVTEISTACTPTLTAPERVLCDQLIRHSSAEYMGANIARVLTCAGFARPRSKHSMLFDSLTGNVRSAWPKFSRKPIEFELTFDTQTSPASMTISLTRAGHGD